jgi:hypothetical protein
MNNKNNSTILDKSDNIISEITNLDLYSNQYDENILIHNMNKLSPHSILITQNNMSNEFISNYILNKKYFIFREDYELTLDDIINYHPNFKFIIK